MRVFVALVLLTFASAALAEAPPARDRGAGRRLLEAGKKAFRERNYEDAQRYFDAAFHRDGTLSIALYNRAFALRKLERWASCASTYRKYLERAPDDLDAIYGLAECERGRDDIARASHLYARYAEREKRSEKSKQLARAQAYIAENPPKKAAALKSPDPKPKPEAKPEPDDDAPTTSRLSRLLAPSDKEPDPEPTLSPKLGKLLKTKPEPEESVSPKLAALLNKKPSAPPPEKSPSKNVGEPIAARIFTTPFSSRPSLPDVKPISTTNDGPSASELAKAELDKERAESAAARGDLKVALAAAEAALAIKPADYALLMIVGRARVEAEPKSALPVFQRAAQIAPERAAPLLAMARVHRALGARDVENHYLRLFIKKNDPDKARAEHEAAQRRLEDP